MRSTALAVNVSGIPAALIGERRWLLWQNELRAGHGDRWAKIPRTATGDHAKANDPITWTTFDVALAAYRTGCFDGLGFCLGNGWAGLDLDHCIDGDTVDPVALPILQRLDDLGVYYEVSPSGTGFKVIGRARRIGGEINFTTASLTPWDGARYFAVTGRPRVPGLSATINIDGLLDDTFPVQRIAAPELGPRPDYIATGDRAGLELIEQPSDDEVIERVLASSQADKFLQLVRGDLSAYGHDHSRADQALVCILAYWCHGDLEQVDRLFRQSGLMRPKWNVPSYRLSTLRKAISR